MLASLTHGALFASALMDAPVITVKQDDKPLERPASRASSSSVTKEKDPHRDREVLVEPTKAEEDAEENKVSFTRKYKPFLLTGLALLILGWWISSTVLRATRHRWRVHFLFPEDHSNL